MGSSGLITKDKSKVEDTSLTRVFEELCPVFMSYGMSYDEYWYGEPYRAKFYLEAHKLKVKQKDEELWIQGMYIYEALCDVSPILHAFSKQGTKPLPYRDSPILSKSEVGKTPEEIEEEKKKQEENERLIAEVHFMRWANDMKKQFENKEQ